MAEPQTPVEESRTKGNATPPTTATEPRSFQETEPRRQSGTARGAQAPDIVARSAQAAAESTRGAGRQAMTAWRQAFDPLLAMQYDVSQWMDEVLRRTLGFHGAPATRAFRPMSHLSAASVFGMPPADLKETEAAHVLSVELPGLTRDDVDLSLEGETLVVCGHKVEETEGASATYRVSERRFGRFERAFPLPPDVDPTKIGAQFRDGVLKVTMPKNAALTQPRSRIEIRG